MKNIVIVFLLSLLNFNCKQKNISPKINLEIESKDLDPNANYYKFFNDVLDKGSILDDNSISFPDLTMNKEYWLQELNRLLSEKKLNYINEENSISESDINYIFEQYSEERKLNVDFNKLSIKKVDSTVLKKTYERLQSPKNLPTKYNGIYGLTLPLFSKNGQIAFFDHSHYCGLLCASNGIFVYELSNGKWQRIGSIGIKETS